jgi:hypothetical protein
MLVVTLSPTSEAKIAPFRRQGVELYAVGIYCLGTIIDHSTHMSEQGCVQWAYGQVHQTKRAAITKRPI